MSGEQSKKKGMRLYELASERLAAGGFRLRKWLSNDENVLKDIEKRERRILRKEGQN